MKADYGGILQPIQQLVAQCVKEVEWGFGRRGLRMVVEFCAGIPVEVTQKANVGSRCRYVAIGTPF